MTVSTEGVPVSKYPASDPNIRESRLTICMVRFGSPPTDTGEGWLENQVSSTSCTPTLSRKTNSEATSVSDSVR